MRIRRIIGAILLGCAALGAGSGCQPDTGVVIDPFFNQAVRSNPLSPLRILYYQFRHTGRIVRQELVDDGNIGAQVLQFIDETDNLKRIIATPALTGVVLSIAEQYPEIDFWSLAHIEGDTIPNYHGVRYDRSQAYIELAEWVSGTDPENGELLFLFDTTTGARAREEVAVFENALIELDVDAVVESWDSDIAGKIERGERLAGSGRFQVVGLFLGNNNASIIQALNNDEIYIITEYIERPVEVHETAVIAGSIVFDLQDAVNTIFQYSPPASGGGCRRGCK